MPWTEQQENLKIDVRDLLRCKGVCELQLKVRVKDEMGDGFYEKPRNDPRLIPELLLVAQGIPPVP